MLQLQDYICKRLSNCCSCLSAGLSAFASKSACVHEREREQRATPGLLGKFNRRSRSHWSYFQKSIYSSFIVGVAFSSTDLKAAWKLQSQSFFWGLSCCEEKQAHILLVGRNIPECIWWLGRKWALAGAQAHWLPTTAQEQPRRCSQARIEFPRWIRFRMICSAFTYLRWCSKSRITVFWTGSGG